MNRTLLSIAASAALLAAALPAAAHTLVFSTPLTSTNGSAAAGSATVTIDPHTLSMKVEATFQNLQTNTLMAHIHCCSTGGASAPIVVPFDDFPTGLKNGSYSSTFDLSLASSWNDAFLQANGGTGEGALGALLVGIDAGQAYVNIHTLGRPAGEITGYLAAVPEPGTYALMLLGLGAAGVVARRRDCGQHAG